MPLSLSVWTAVRNSSHVAGSVVMPASSKAVGVVPEADEAEVERHAVVLAVDLVHAEGARVDRRPSSRRCRRVMSLTRPASTCWRRPPPPQVWNRSGTSPCWSRVVSLVLNASFSLTWMSIVTFGLRRRVLVGEVLPQAEARVVVLDVVPGDGHRLAGGLRRLGARRGRGRRCRGRGRRRRRGGGGTAARTGAEHEHRARGQGGDPPSGHRHQSSLLNIADLGWVRGSRRMARNDGHGRWRRTAQVVRSSSSTGPKVAKASPLVSARQLYDRPDRGVNPVSRSARNRGDPWLRNFRTPSARLRAMSTTPEPRAARNGTTIAVIAREAGVSVPTVSKVINGRSDVAPATRRRVEAVIRRHGYQRPRPAVATGAAPGAALPRAGERVGPRDRARRRAGRRAPPAGRSC